ncbi:DUF736 domain-containing protein, partial [Citrobacter freundii]
MGLVVKNPGAAVAAPGFKAQNQNAPSPPSGGRRRGRAQAALCARNHEAHKCGGAPRRRCLDCAPPQWAG